jgi:hypothetical protein
MLIGGRHLGTAADPPVRFVVAIDGREAAQWESAAGFFVRQVDLPAGALAGEGPLARLTIHSQPAGGAGAIATAIEQFDLQTSGSLMWAFDEGWHEAEYDPSVGVWRWTSNRATLRILGAATAVGVTLRIESPRRYFEDEAFVKVTAGNRTLAEAAIGDDRTWTVAVPLDALRAADGRVTIETNRTFVPAEGGGGADRRALGLRILDVQVVAQP